MNLLEGFRQWLIEDGKSPQTIASYCNDVKQFQCYVDTRQTADMILSRYLFVQYKQQLIDESYKVSTINKKVNSLKVFNDYLRQQGIVEETYIQLRKDRIPIAIGSEKVVEALTDEQVEQILAHVSDEKRITLRNRLILHLLLYTAVRVLELVSIKLSDIDFMNRTLTVEEKEARFEKLVFDKT